LPRGGAAW